MTTRLAKLVGDADHLIGKVIGRRLTFDTSPYSMNFKPAVAALRTPPASPLDWLTALGKLDDAMLACIDKIEDRRQGRFKIEESRTNSWYSDRHVGWCSPEARAIEREQEREYAEILRELGWLRWQLGWLRAGARLRVIRQALGGKAVTFTPLGA